MAAIKALSRACTSARLTSINIKRAHCTRRPLADQLKGSNGHKINFIVIYLTTFGYFLDDVLRDLLANNEIPIV